MDFKLGLMGFPTGFNHHQMQQQQTTTNVGEVPTTGDCNGKVSPSPSGSNKQCSRPVSELDSSDDFRVPANKMARTESFSSKPCSPSDSTSAASDEAASMHSALTSPTDSSGGHQQHSQSQRMMTMHHYHQRQQQQQQQTNGDSSGVNIALPPPPQFLNNPFLKQQQQQHQQQQQQQMMMMQLAQQYHQPEPAFQFKQTGGGMLLGLHEAAFGPRYPFTSTQWAELEHQALVFKYMMARAPVPPELIAPIRKSVAATSMQHQSGWSQSSGAAPVHHLDIEPGRCRRTDGKKWRCARPIVPDQKYCERHMNRGRNKKRGGANNNTVTAPIDQSTAVTVSQQLQQQQQQQQQRQCHSSQLLQMNPTPGAIQHDARSNVLQQQQLHQQQNSMKNLSHVPQQQQQQQQHAQFVRGYGAMNAAGHMAVTAQSSSSSMFQSSLHSALSSKDRITSFDLRPEQLLFSEVSGSARAMRIEAEAAAAAAAVQVKEEFYSKFGYLQNEGDVERENFLQQQQQHRQQQQQQHQQQHNASGGSYLDSAAAAIYEKPDTHASLRQLFVEASATDPSRDTSTITSWSDSDEQQRQTTKANSNQHHHQHQSSAHSNQHQHQHHHSSTHLSIAMGCSDFPSAVTTTDNNNKNISSLKLSMSSRNVCDEDVESAAPKSAAWFGSSTAREGSASLGGPLAEAFHHHHHQLRLTKTFDNKSPTGVLQKATLGCFSESGSSASSPTVKGENLLLS